MLFIASSDTTEAAAGTSEEPTNTEAFLPDENQQPRRSQKGGWTFYLTFSIISAVCGASFACGYTVGVTNEPYDVMSRFVNDSFYNQDGKVLSTSELTTQWSLIVSLFLVGGCIGTVWFPEIMGNRLGRTKTLLYVAGIGAVSNILCFIAPYTGSYIPLYVGRTLCGFHSGIACCILPALLIELPPVNLRGACGSLSELTLQSGIVLSSIVGLPNILGNENWHILFLIGAAFYIAHLIGLFFSAESPRWLIDMGRDKEALEVFRKLRRGWDSAAIEAEYEETKAMAISEAAIQHVSIKDFFKTRQLWWPLFLSLNLHMSQQLTGIFPIMTYTSEVLIKAGFDDKMSKWANLGLSIANIAATVISMAIIDRFGRRLFFLGGLLGIGISQIVLTITLFTGHFYACIVAFALFRFMFSIGPGPITWYMPAEMFSQGARPLALSICLFVNWFIALVVGLIFPHMRELLEDYVFLPFVLFCFVEVAFLFLFLPETNGITVEQVVAKFAPGQPLLQFRKKKATNA